MLEWRGKALRTIDLHVASRIRERRIVLGISQPKLAAALGLTFQQVYKYEQGKSRIGDGRLYEFGKVLGSADYVLLRGYCRCFDAGCTSDTRRSHL